MDEKKSTIKLFQESIFWEYTKKIFSEHVIVVVFESKGLQC